MKRQTLLFLVCVLALFASVQKMGAATVYSTEVDGVTFYFTVSGTEATITNSTDYSSTSGSASYTASSIEIPSTITYNSTEYTVTAIDQVAFNKCTSLESITIPSTVTSIGAEAFYKCTGLTKVDLSSATGLETVSYQCFYGCTSLTEIDFSACTELTYLYSSTGGECFYGCTALQSASFKGCSKLTSLYNKTFYGCTKLESVDLTGCTSLTSLGQHCFYQCTSLTSIDLSECTSLTTLGQYCFYYCSALTEITIPSTVTTINGVCFQSCSSLTSVDFSSATALTSLGTQCFQSCTSLTEIDLTPCTSLTTLGSQCFYYSYNITLIKLPASITTVGDNCFKALSADIFFYSDTPPTFGSTILATYTVKSSGKVYGGDSKVYVPPFSLSSYQEADNMTDYAEQIYPFVDQTVSGSAGMGTIALPFEATIPDGLTAYTVGSLNDDGTEVALTAVSSGETLAAGTPCIVMISDEEESDDEAATASEDEETTTANLECEWLGTTNALGTDDSETTYTVESVVSKDNAYGVFQKTTLTSVGISSDSETSTASEDEYTYYILQQHSGDASPKFYKVGSTNVTVGAYRAYLALSSSESSAESIAFTFIESDEVTGIGSVSVEQTAGSGLYYDLQGRQVRTPQKGGIYIKDGKKVVI